MYKRQGGREHAIALKLKQSPKVTELYCCPSNAGINQIATPVPVKATDIDGVVKFAKANHMDMVVVAPDDPLVLGMVDALNQEGIKTFGPRGEAVSYTHLTLVVGSDASGEAKRNALLWYGVNLFLNFSWTPVFFGLKQPLAAFVVLLLLIMVTVIVLVSFYKIRPAAGYLLIPYLAWLIFAGYLNFGIYLLNR